MYNIQYNLVASSVRVWLLLPSFRGWEAKPLPTLARRMDELDNSQVTDTLQRVVMKFLVFAFSKLNKNSKTVLMYFL